MTTPGTRRLSTIPQSYTCSNARMDLLNQTIPMLGLFICIHSRKPVTLAAKRTTLTTLNHLNHLKNYTGIWRTSGSICRPQAAVATAQQGHLWQTTTNRSTCLSRTSLPPIQILPCRSNTSSMMQIVTVDLCENLLVLSLHAHHQITQINMFVYLSLLHAHR